MARRLIDQDRRREQRRQSILLDRLEAQFRGRIQRELAAAIRDALTFYEHTSEVPVMADLRDRVEAVYRQMSETSIRVFGVRVLNQGKALGHDLEVKDFAAIFSRMSQVYIGLESVRRRITSVSSTTRQQIVNAIAAGQREGLGVAAIARQIRDQVDVMTTWRAALIARTETHGAANYGAQEAARETGLRLRKEWVAAADERTREDHKAADGQIVGMDEPFQVGSDMLMFPGDPAGSPEQVINCRCAVSHVVIE